ncbi:hypothetical protein ACWDYJ_35700, partial [Streptomyces sp. NPDC003042]
MTASNRPPVTSDHSGAQWAINASATTGARAVGLAGGEPDLGVRAEAEQGEAVSVGLACFDVDAGVGRGHA